MTKHSVKQRKFGDFDKEYVEFNFDNLFKKLDFLKEEINFDQIKLKQEELKSLYSYAFDFIYRVNSKDGYFLRQEILGEYYTFLDEFKKLILTEQLDFERLPNGEHYQEITKPGFYKRVFGEPFNEEHDFSFEQKQIFFDVNKDNLVFIVQDAYNNYEEYEIDKKNVLDLLANFPDEKLNKVDKLNAAILFFVKDLLKASISEHDVEFENYLCYDNRNIRSAISFFNTHQEFTYNNIEVLERFISKCETVRDYTKNHRDKEDIENRLWMPREIVYFYKNFNKDKYVCNI